MNEQQAGPNPQHVINSLVNQIGKISADTAIQIAQLNAVIIGQAEEAERNAKHIKELEMENKQLHQGA